MYWVVAEITELTSHRSGHAYLTLVEKGPRGEPVAQVRATIWAARWVQVAPQFAQATGQRLGPGMRVLLAVTVEFHARYGLSLEVRAVDASFTVGELARARAESLARLDEAGLLTLNAALPLPPVAHRLAVVSSATAAGYQDFVQQLAASPYAFRLTLFEATMQGPDAPASVRRALTGISRRVADFDAIIVIRGGGAKTDLLAFDDYALAEALARAPLPVLTGIGHERDESLADLVAHTAFKTPTAVAAFLIDHSAEAESHLLAYAERLRAAVTGRLQAARRALEAPLVRLPLLLRARLDRETARLTLAEARTHALDPARLLARGFTLTTHPDGRLVRFAADLAPGDEIRTVFADGEVSSRVLGGGV